MFTGNRKYLQEVAREFRNVFTGRFDPENSYWAADPGYFVATEYFGAFDKSGSISPRLKVSGAEWGSQGVVRARGKHGRESNGKSHYTRFVIKYFAYCINL